MNSSIPDSEIIRRDSMGKSFLNSDDIDMGIGTGKTPVHVYLSPIERDHIRTAGMQMLSGSVIYDLIDSGKMIVQLSNDLEELQIHNDSLHRDIGEAYKKIAFMKTRGI